MHTGVAGVQRPRSRHDGAVANRINASVLAVPAEAQTVKLVVFYLDGSRASTDTTEPFAVPDDDAGDFQAWTKLDALADGGEQPSRLINKNEEEKN